MPRIGRRDRTPAHRQPRVLVAAASRVDLTKRQPRPKRQDWQADAWVYYDEVPEVKQLVLWRGNQMSKLRLFVATTPVDDPDGEPIPVDDEDGGVDPRLALAARTALARLRSRVGGTGEILRRLEQNTEVTGECYIVGFGARPADLIAGKQAEMEDWTVASITEVEYKPGGAGGAGQWIIKRQFDDGKTERTLDPQYDTIFRAWQPHANKWDLADCSMRGLLGECESLMLLSNQLRAESKSRANAGILTIPNELSLGTPDATVSEDGQDAPQDPLMQLLISAFAGVVEDPQSVLSVAPLLLRGPAEYLKPDYVRKIDLSRQSDATLDTRINVRIERVARGLNAPPEQVMGHQQTTFANARQVDTDTWEDYLEPKAVWVSDLFTIGYLHDELLKEGFGPEDVGRLFVWYDASDVVAQPDQAEGADAAFDRLAISWAAYRRSKGFAEDDAADEVEMLLRLAFGRGPIAPNVTNALLEGIDTGDVPFPLPDPAGGAGAAGDQNAAARVKAVAALLMALRSQEGRAAAQAASTAHSPMRALTSSSRRRSGELAGRSLVAIDRELRTRMLVASNDAMNRALEKAGARARSKVSGEMRAEVREVANLAVVARLGRPRLVAAGIDDEDLLAGAWDALEEQFMAWGSAAQRQAINAVNKIVGGFSQSRRDQMGLRMADSLGEAWSWMKEALTSLAEARLYDPHPSAPRLGEWDPSMRVPPGLVRQAISRAGGAAGLQTADKGDAWVTLTDGGSAPAGGVATGEIVRDVLRDEGASADGYVWDYGAAMRERPFEPHVELDGIEFSNFDDPVLSNDEGWPDFGFYMPGDHDGCLCDAVPIVIAPGDSA